MKNTKLNKMLFAAMFLAMCLVLPFITGQMRELGNMLCLMHLPVLLCGFICGPVYGAAVGFTAPLLRFALFGMPPLMPVGAAMCAELLTYGVVAGILYRTLPKKKPYIYVSLICAMLAGRIVWGGARLVIYGLGRSDFGWAAFLSGAFTNAVPGIILQIVIVPVLVMALEKQIKEK